MRGDHIYPMSIKVSKEEVLQVTAFLKAVKADRTLQAKLNRLVLTTMDTYNEFFQYPSSVVKIATEAGFPISEACVPDFCNFQWLIQLTFDV